ncbi:hypothetical protein PENTCL1PPCAC_12939, partial [Pristionchus entomophagus]
LPPLRPSVSLSLPTLRDSSSPLHSSTLIHSHTCVLMLLLVASVLFCLLQAPVTGMGGIAWTSAEYPDIRGATSEHCQANVPPDQNLYICDPDRVLNKSQTTWLNAMLHDLTLSTPCPCQRRSQCSGGLDNDGGPLHGFVVSIAILKNVQMTMHSPSENDLTVRSEGFCRSLEGKWALGDCGNSIIIFVWQHYKKMIIWPARLAERYVTVEERRAILSKVNKLAQGDEWYSALTEVIGSIRRELNGEPETRVDTGTLSLVISVGVAVALTIIITLCVCAFRCCGNLKSEDGSVAGNSYLGRVDSLRNSIVRRGSSLRRSISRSPKFAQGPAFFFTENTIV